MQQIREKYDKITIDIIRGVYDIDNSFIEEFDRKNYTSIAKTLRETEDKNDLIDDDGVLTLPAQIEIEIEEEYNSPEYIKPATLEALNKEQPKIISQEPHKITSKLTTIDQSTTLQVDTPNVRACSRTI